ncbi:MULTISPECIES: MliC family protein [Neisseria]|uniref:MliC family protein n=1 Tax=Neisseria TaxID=482 RepID=UPI00069BE477|nr:MliC family protein [Neisseria arctica]UOO86880.1 MliC family protein [Neisseria arctica]
MNTSGLKFVALSVVLSLLSACTPAEKATDTAVSAPASAAETASSATGTGVASEIVAVAPAAGEINSAKWLSFQCDDGKTIDARYAGAGTAAVAQLKFNGQTLDLKYDGSRSNEDLIAFSNDQYGWTISNQYAGNLYKEDGGFLVRFEKQEVNGMPTDVESIQVKNCMPVE